MIKNFLHIIVCILLLSISSNTFANDYFTSYHILSAYDKALEGNSVFYPLNFHPSERALLVDDKDNRKIRWESEAIPNFYGDQKLKFAFTYSFNNPSGEMVSYKLAMDSIHHLDFEFIEGVLFAYSDSGLEIELETKETNHENSHSGIGFITLPIEYLSPGQAINFTLESTSQDETNSWFMLYQSSIKQGINFFDTDVIIEKDGDEYRELGVEIINFGEEQKLNVKINETDNEFIAEEGISYHPIYLTKNTTPRELEIEILVNDSIVSFERFRLASIKTKNIYLMNESYSYTGLFPDGQSMELANLKQAIQLCGNNSKKDLWSKFHWSAIEFQTIQKYIDNASSEQKEYLLNCIQNGFIEISPAYKQIITSLSNNSDYSYLFEDGLSLAAESGIDKLSQVQIDPSGISPNYMEYLLDRDITEIGIFQNSTYQIRPEYLKTHKQPHFYQSHYKGKDLMIYNQNDAIYYDASSNPLSNYTISKHLYNLKKRTIKYPNSLLRLIPTKGSINKDISQFVQNWNATHKSPKLIVSNFNTFARQFKKISGPKLKGSRTVDAPFWNECILNEYSAFVDLNKQFEDIRANECIGVIQQKYYDRSELTQPLEKYWDLRNNTIQKKSFYASPNHEENDFEIKTIDSRTAVIFNQLPRKRGGLLTISISNNFRGARNKEGKTIPFQRIGDGQAVMLLDEIDAYGFEEVTFTRNENKYFTSSNRIKLKFDTKKGVYVLKSSLSEENLIKPSSELFALLLVNGNHPKNNTITEHDRELIKIKDGPLCTIYKVYSKLNGISCEKTIYLHHPVNEIKVGIKLDNLPSSDYSVHMSWPLNIPSNDYKTDCQLFELDRSNYNKKGNLNFFSSQFLCIKNQEIQADIYSSTPSFWQIGELSVTPSEYGWRNQIGYNNQFISYLTSNYFGYSKKVQQQYSNEFTVSFTSANKAIESYYLDQQYPLIPLENVYTNRQNSLFDWDNEQLYIQKMYPHSEGKGIILEIKNKSHEPQKMEIEWNGKKRYKVYEIDNSDKKIGILRGDLKWKSYQLTRVLLE